MCPSNAGAIGSGDRSGLLHLTSSIFGCGLQRHFQVLFLELLKFLSTQKVSPQFTVKLAQRFVVLRGEPKSMAASFLPSIFVPIVGWVFPAVAMAFLFIYIERDDAAGL